MRNKQTNLLTSLVCIAALTGAPAAFAQSQTVAAPADATQSAASFSPNYMGEMDNLLHWTHFPLRVAFVNEMRVGRTNLEDLALDGFDLWREATDGAAAYEVVTDPDKADVTVSFDMLAGHPRNLETLGTTYVSFQTRRKTLWHARIHLNVWAGMSRYDLDKFRLSAAHEFGHALGLNGHSKTPTDLMYFSSGYSSGVSLRDLNTLRYAYRGIRAFAPTPPRQQAAASGNKPARSKA